MRIEHAPAIKNKHITLRQIELTDIPAWYHCLSNPKVTEHTSWAITSADDLKPVIASYLSADDSSPIRFAIRRVPDDAFLGTIGFHTISARNHTAEIAYEFDADYWGQGLAAACCHALVEWGFKHCGYVRIQATVLDSNLASARVLEKCGFTLEGKLRNFRIVRGEPRDYWLYSIISG